MSGPLVTYLCPRCLGAGYVPSCPGPFGEHDGSPITCGHCGGAGRSTRPPSAITFGDPNDELEEQLRRARDRIAELEGALAEANEGWRRSAENARRLGELKLRIPRFDLITHLHRQRAFSQRAFGPGNRTAGVLDHIRKELLEIEKDPSDIFEWIDVVLLACDGAWRNGHGPEAIAEALFAKLAKNEARQWPDWRTAEPGKAIEHVRSDEPSTTQHKQEGT